MRKVNTFNWKIIPVIGAGAYLDIYTKEITGLDGWVYNIILPFIRIQIGVIYLP